MWLLIGVLAFFMYHRRISNVQKYDSLHRQEQRAMQNREIEEVDGKKVRFVLFDQEGK